MIWFVTIIFFWVLKLKKDFDVAPTDVKKAKDYYKELIRWMKKYPNINELYSKAVTYNRLDLVKISLNRGADINYYPPNTSTMLIRALFFDHDEILNYLLEKGTVDTKDGAITNIRSFMTFFETIDTTNQIRGLSILFEKIFPRIYKLSSFKKFWKGALDMLERNRQFIPETYDRRIDEIRALAMD